MPSYLRQLSNPIFQSWVKPKTLEIYKAALCQFTTWAIELILSLVDPAEWDDALLEFRYAYYQKLTKSKFSNLVASLEFFAPSLKRSLPWTHTMITAWARSLPIRHTVALTSGPGKLLAVHMAVRGFTRLALGMLIQISTGLRPGEMLGLMPEHVMLPEEQDTNRADGPTLLVLGVKHGTKARRAQVASLSAATAPLPLLLKLCKESTAPGNYLFPHTLADYRGRLRETEEVLGTSMHYTPHSPRAGFATEARLNGLPFEEIREAGRWQSDSSLRIYLDLVGSTATLRSLRARGFGPQLQEAEARWPCYFGLLWQGC